MSENDNNLRAIDRFKENKIWFEFRLAKNWVTFERNYCCSRKTFGVNNKMLSIERHVS